MITNYYYFLSCVLHALSLGVKPEISFDEFIELLKLNLTEKDFSKVEQLCSYIDLLNLKAFWREKPLDPRGNLDEKRLEEIILVEDYFPKFVFDYLETYQDVDQRMKHFSYLLIHFFQYMSKNENYFISEYFSFERNLHLVLCALRVKNKKKDLSHELTGVDFTDLFVQDMMAQKDLDTYEPPVEFLPVKELFFHYKSHPKKLHRALLEFRLQKIDELIMDCQFTIDEILGYTAKLFIILDFDQLSPSEGQALVDTIA